MKPRELHLRCAAQFRSDGGNLETIHRVVNLTEPFGRLTTYIVRHRVILINCQCASGCLISTGKVQFPIQQKRLEVQRRSEGRLKVESLVCVHLCLLVIAHSVKIFRVNHLPLGRAETELRIDFVRTINLLSVSTPKPIRANINLFRNSISRQSLKERHSSRKTHLARDNLSARSILDHKPSGKGGERIYPQNISIHLYHGTQTHLISAADSRYRKPILIPFVGSIRREKSLLERSIYAIKKILVEESAALKLDILRALVGEQPHPDVTLLRLCPTEVFTSELFVAKGIVEHSKIVMFPICAEEALVGASWMKGFVNAEILIRIERQVATGFIDRIWAGDTVMPYSVCRRVYKFEVVRSLDTGVCPSVIGLILTGGVVPKRARPQPHRVLGKIDLHRPRGAGKQFEYSDVAAHASVLLDLCLPLNGMGTRRGVTDDSVVKLNSTAGPWATERNFTELHDIVVIKHLFSRCLVIDGPYLAADFRHYAHTNPIVFENHNLPYPLRGVEVESFIFMIRIHISRR